MLPTVAELILQAPQIAHLEPRLEAMGGVGAMYATLDTGRPRLLARLKDAGIASLTDRQAVANALGRARRAGAPAARDERAEPARASIPSMVAPAPIEPAERRAGPVRILCLHGTGTNSKVMRAQTGRLRSMLGSDFELSYLQGARPWTGGVPERFAKHGPYYAWYGVECLDPSDEREYIERLSDPRVPFEYSAVDEAIARVRSHIDATGPYDALLGFSAAAVLITMLTADVIRGGGPRPTWRRNLLFSGMPPRDPRYSAWYRPPNPPLPFPATLVYGRADEFYAYGLGLTSCYDSPVVFEHGEGHRFPSDREFNAGLREHLREALLTTDAPQQ